MNEQELRKIKRNVKEREKKNKQGKPDRKHRSFEFKKERKKEMRLMKNSKVFMEFLAKKKANFFHRGFAVKFS